MPIQHDDEDLGCAGGKCTCGGKCGCGGDMKKEASGELCGSACETCGLGCMKCGTGVNGIVEDALAILRKPAPPLHTTAPIAGDENEKRYWALDGIWNGVLFVNVNPPPKDKPAAWLAYQAAHPEAREAVSRWRQLVQDHDAGRMTSEALDQAEKDIATVVGHSAATDTPANGPLSAGNVPPFASTAGEVAKAAQEAAERLAKTAGDAAGKAAGGAIDKAADKVKEKVKEKADEAMGTAAKVGIGAAVVVGVSVGGFALYRLTRKKTRSAKWD